MITKFKIYENFSSLENTINYYASKGYIENIKQMIIDGTDINAISDLETTPLLSACREGEIETVDYLLNAGANVNYVTKTGKYNALYITALNEEEIDIFKLLIDAGCDWNQKDINNQDFIDILIKKRKFWLLEEIKKLYPKKYDLYLKKIKSNKFNL
jgi:ankyrin repeat protein